MLNKDEILRLAKTSKLSLSGENLKKMIVDMGGIIEFVDKINSVSEGTDIDFVRNEHETLRKDVVKESFPQTEILKNSIKESDGYFMIRGHK